MQTGGFTYVAKITGAQVGADAAAYATGDVIGDQSPIAVECLRGTGASAGTGVLQTVTIQDLSKQSIALDVVIFDSQPTATTFTDNAALDIADADLPKVIGVVNVLASDYAAFADNSVATLKNIGLPIQSRTAPYGKVWICLVTRGAPTYVADELSVVLGVLQD